MARFTWKRFAKRAVKTALAVLVAAYLYRHIARTWRDLAAHGESIRLSPLWVLVGGLLYLAGLTACAVFYAQVLAAGTPPVGGMVAIRGVFDQSPGEICTGQGARGCDAGEFDGTLRRGPRPPRCRRFTRRSR